MILYKVRSYNNTIYEDEYERVTPRYAIAGGRRERLRTSCSALFPTREEAVEYKRKELQRNLMVAEAQVTRAREWLSEFEEA